MLDKQKKEIYRKSIHVSSMILPLAFRYLFHSNRKYIFSFLVPLTLASLLVEIIRLEHKNFKRIFYNIFGIMLRKHEVHDFTGATYLLISAILCIAVFPKDISFIALSFLAIGDTLAAIIGIPFGKRKLFGSKKSLEGSLSCFIGTFVFALFFIHPLVALFGAIAATTAEFSNIPLDDNFKIPIFSGIVMSIMNIFV
ncbi:MAG: phosphatidate cytidylyltransferase [Candidatus Cloacimonetes bacterium]|nr:phosphatidate cytidylyltransferase [Candidatus Cloacimonadota bacterium]